MFFLLTWAFKRWVRNTRYRVQHFRVRNTFTWSLFHFGSRSSAPCKKWQVSPWAPIAWFDSFTHTFKVICWRLRPLGALIWSQFLLIFVPWHFCFRELKLNGALLIIRIFWWCSITRHSCLFVCFHVSILLGQKVHTESHFFLHYLSLRVSVLPNFLPRGQSLLFPILIKKVFIFQHGRDAWFGLRCFFKQRIKFLFLKCS